MNTPLDPKALLPLGPEEWKQAFYSFWPYYYADLAGMKESFFEPLGKTDQHIFATWKTCQDPKRRPVVVFCPQNKQAWILNEPSPKGDEDRVFDTAQLRAFLDIH